MHILTQNLDASSFNVEDRLLRFLEIVKEIEPDVILLQEVKRNISEKLFREMNILGYKRAFCDSLNQRPSLVIFSKLPILTTKVLEFISAEEKELLVVKVQHGNETFWVCTAQLDFGISQKRKQITSLSSLLRNIGVDVLDKVVFGGDTRLFEYQRNIAEPDGWVDAWYECGLPCNQYTYDSEINPLTPLPHKDRMDRIWCRNASPKAFELVGTDEGQTICSSHFGILVEV